MKTTDTFARLGAALAAAACIALSAVPAGARTAYVQDGAGLLDQSTIAALNSEIGAFNSQTGKEVVVVTVASLDGQTLRAAAQKAFEDQQVNGVLIFLSKAERQDLVVGDSASSAFFPPGEFQHIHDAMRAYFREGDFDGGVNAGVGLVIDQYRSHARGGVQTQPQTQNQSQPVPTYQRNVSRTGGSSLGHLFWLIIILVAGFLIIRAIFRMFSGPRIYPPAGGPMGPGGPMAGPGYGPGYGAGYGGGYGGGGGGSFFSGLLGGLGGAFLGNELFGNRGGGTVVGGPADAAGGNWGAPATPDASGWQADPGQADMGNAGGGDWGSGGGFDAGGGGGFDGGGGGGFDGGGGGGDSGGGW